MAWRRRSKQQVCETSKAPVDVQVNNIDRLAEGGLQEMMEEAGAARQVLTADAAYVQDLIAKLCSLVRQVQQGRQVLGNIEVPLLSPSSCRGTRSHPAKQAWVSRAPSDVHVLRSYQSFFSKKDSVKSIHSNDDFDHDVFAEPEVRSQPVSAPQQAEEAERDVEIARLVAELAEGRHRQIEAYEAEVAILSRADQLRAAALRFSKEAEQQDRIAQRAARQAHALRSPLTLLVIASCDTFL